MKTVAIIIAAYNADKYILDCYNSVKNQIPLEGYSVDVRIGVDGCQKTADVLRRAGIPFYWYEKNVGAYIMRNSLIYFNPFIDVFSIFDADDVMFTNYISSTLSLNADAVMTAKINCNENLKPIQGARIEYGGAITFTQNILDSLGGFYGGTVGRLEGTMINYNCECGFSATLVVPSKGYKNFEIRFIKDTEN